MSHQPFETWILGSEGMAPDEKRALYEHLENCSQCRRLQQRWQSVHLELRTRRMAAPAPGFAQRWQTSLAERRARAQRRQAWKIFGILVGSALLVLLVLTVYVMATSSLSDWLGGVIQALSSSRDIFSLLIYLGQAWLDNTPFALNLALWIYLTVALCLLVLVWVLILWRTSRAGVRNQ